MRIKSEQKTEGNVAWKISFNSGHIVIVARNLVTGARKLCEYDCKFNYRDGYDENDVIEAYRIVDEFREGLKDEQRD